MELRQLQYLITCAQTKSFSKAASVLFTSQSNVSKTIAALERELGKNLFTRKQYGIELTAKGRQVYNYALSMLECSSKILDCMEEEEVEELRVSFQPSSWFAYAFCEYYIQHGSAEEKYNLFSAPVDEIIRRLIADQDQLGFAYIDTLKLEKLDEMLRNNHISHIVLKRARTVLHIGSGREEEESSVIPLIQGIEDDYSGLSLWKEKTEEGQEHRKLKVKVSTNSDYIMQIMLQRTNLSNISPEYLSHHENSLRNETLQAGEDDQSICFVCLFRNDHEMALLPKRFLSFIKKYINEV